MHRIQNFDARKQWSGCISDVMDQKECEGCWAYSTALVLSDRIRIQSMQRNEPSTLFAIFNGVLNSLSPAYMIRTNLCKIAPEIADPNMCMMGCKGGYIDKGMKYLQVHGCITLYDDHHKVPHPFYFRATGYHKITGIENIMNELSTKGPVVAGFAMYQNCFDEKFNRFYDRIEGKLLFHHAITIVGWLTYNSKKYWICRNSYGKKYMDNGYFYVLLGHNLCNIESDVWTIHPL
jgi:cathepsin B